MKTSAASSKASNDESVLNRHTPTAGTAGIPARSSAGLTYLYKTRSSLTCPELTGRLKRYVIATAVAEKSAKLLETQEK